MGGKYGTRPSKVGCCGRSTDREVLHHQILLSEGWMDIPHEL